MTSAANGKPLRAVQVTLNNAGGQPEPRVGQVAMTNADGRYEFTNLPEQRYQLTVAKPGYISRGRGQAYLATDGGPIQLSAGEIADHVDFALPRGGVIAGRITDEFGEPQGGIRVRAMRSVYLSGGRTQLQPSGLEVSTNDLGEFRIYDLMPGAYIVGADMDETRMLMAGPREGTEVQLDTGNDDSNDLATTYYPGTAMIADARTVSVDVSKEVSASFSLSPARLVHISGVIRDSRGRSVGDGLVLLMSPEGSTTNLFIDSQTTPDGHFMLSKIPPGDHVLQVIQAGSDLQSFDSLEFASVPVSVHERDITDLILNTNRGISVTGRVIYQGTPLPAHAEPFRLIATVPDLSNTPFDAHFAEMHAGDVDESGTFSFRAMPGRILFRIVGLPPPWALKSVMLDGEDITDVPLDTGNFKEIAGLEVVVYNRQPRLTGYARTAAGEMVKNYKVAVFPIQKEGAVPMRFMYTTGPDQTGRFQIGRLPAGEYLGVATQPFEQWFEWDPEFQKKVKPGAKRFQLIDGETMTIDLPYVE